MGYIYLKKSLSGFNPINTNMQYLQVVEGVLVYTKCDVLLVIGTVPIPSALT